MHSTLQPVDRHFADQTISQPPQLRPYMIEGAAMVQTATAAIASEANRHPLSCMPTVLLAWVWLLELLRKQ